MTHSTASTFFTQPMRTLTGIVAATGLALSMISTAAHAKPVNWDVAAHFPTTMPHTGVTMKRVSTLLNDVTDGDIKLKFVEPGALVPPNEILQSLQMGAIDAGYSAPGFWAGQEPALQVFGGLPFGPEPDSFMAWFYGGEGREIYQSLYDKFNVHAIPCGVIPAEAAGWFNKEINSIDDFKGLKMRIFGLGGLVLERFGASPQLLGVGDTIPALELGTIDAAEMVIPSIDYQFKFHQLAKHYYFPGWHQRTTFTDLLINKNAWEKVDSSQQQLIELVCSDAVRHAMAHGLWDQPEALQKIEAEGASIKRLPDDVMTDLRQAWDEVVDEQMQADENFARAYGSLLEFVDSQQQWETLQKLD